MGSKQIAASQPAPAIMTTIKNTMLETWKIVVSDTEAQVMIEKVKWCQARS